MRPVSPSTRMSEGPPGPVAINGEAGHLTLSGDQGELLGEHRWDHGDVHPLVEAAGVGVVAVPEDAVAEPRRLAHRRAATPPVPRARAGRHPRSGGANWWPFSRREPGRLHEHALPLLGMDSTDADHVDLVVEALTCYRLERGDAIGHDPDAAGEAGHEIRDQTAR